MVMSVAEQRKRLKEQQRE